jgi:hypothetical protein
MTETTITADGEHLPAQPAKPASTTKKPHRASQGVVAKRTEAEVATKPARQSRASRGASQSANTADKPKATTRKPAAPAKPGRKPAAKPEKAEGPSFHDYRRELFRAVIVSAGELVQEYPMEHRADLAMAISRQLHHLTNKKAGWPKGKLPVPDRSDWR